MSDLPSNSAMNDAQEFGLEPCPIEGLSDMGATTSLSGDLSCQLDPRKRKAEPCPQMPLQDEKPRRRICRSGDVNNNQGNVPMDVQMVTAAVQNQLQLAAPNNPADILGSKCRDLICGLKPFAEFIGQIAMNTFATKPRLQQRLLVAFWMIKSETKTLYTAYHLYILRVCELLILACLKPAVETVINNSDDQTATERLHMRLMFWRRTECEALVLYLLQHCRHAPSLSRILRAMPNVMLESTEAANVIETLRKFDVIEDAIKSAMTRRIADLQHMIGAATGNANIASAAIPSATG